MNLTLRQLLTWTAILAITIFALRYLGIILLALFGFLLTLVILDSLSGGSALDDIARMISTWLGGT